MEIKEESSIGKRIRDARIRKGLSQEVMAELLEMSTTGYAKIEQDKTPNLSIKRLEQIAEKLDSNLHEILLNGDKELAYIHSNTPTITADNISDQASVVGFIVHNNLPMDYQLIKQENLHLKDKIKYLESELASQQEINNLLRR